MAWVLLAFRLPWRGFAYLRIRRRGALTPPYIENTCYREHMLLRTHMLNANTSLARPFFET